MPCKHERKDGMATKSDKIHFRARKYQRQRVALHNNKSVSSLRSHNNPVYIQNNTSSKYIKQKFRERKKRNKPANKWGISILLLLVTITQKISMDIKELNNIIDQWNLVNIY